MDNTATFSNPAVKLGRWWFRNRSLSPAPFFLLMMYLPPNYRPDPIGLAVLLALIALFEGLRIWAVGYAGSATRTRNDSVSSFVHAGPYRWVRNPLYIANMALYSLCGLAFGFTYLTAILFLYTCIQYSLIVRYEEEVLMTTFGEAYQLYRQEVPRWGGFSKAAYPSSSHTFDLKRSIRSERTTLYLLGILVAAIIVKRYLA
jgi:protein-S-isoprenylcysteine O-methyltransferase Ste14